MSNVAEIGGREFVEDEKPESRILDLKAYKDGGEIKDFEPEFSLFEGIGNVLKEVRNAYSNTCNIIEGKRASTKDLLIFSSTAAVFAAVISIGVFAKGSSSKDHSSVSYERENDYPDYMEKARAEEMLEQMESANIAADRGEILLPSDYSLLSEETLDNIAQQAAKEITSIYTSMNK